MESEATNQQGLKEWKITRLDQCARIIGGSTPKTSVKEYWNGDICWTTPKDLSDLVTPYLEETPRRITKVGLDSCGAEILPEGSVLFSSRAPIGHVAINIVPMATNQGFKSFVPSPEKLDAKFLYYWLRKNRDYFNSIGNGATFKEVSKAVVSQVEILLPPIAEQKRIAAILDKAEELRGLRRKALGELDAIVQSIFLKMFGDPVTNPKGWEKYTLEKIAIKITDGEHLNPIFSSDGMPIVMAGNVLEDSVDLHNTKKVALSLGQRFRRRCNPERGDILLVSRGATIGRLCAVDFSEECCLMGSVILIKLNNLAVQSNYLKSLLKHPSMHRKLFNTSGSSAQQAIYLKDIKWLTCLLPPISLQQEFSRRVEAIEHLKATHRESLAQLDALFTSLQHRAFRGEL